METTFPPLSRHFIIHQRRKKKIAKDRKRLLWMMLLAAACWLFYGCAQQAAPSLTVAHPLFV